MNNTLLGICFLVLVAFNIFLYHKIFDILYFDLGKGLLKELVGAILVASIEIGLIVSVGKWILGIIIKVLGISLKAIIFIAGIVIVIYIIYCIYTFIKKKNNIDDKENTKNNSNNNKVPKKNKKIFCPYCHKEIMKTAKFCNFCGKMNKYEGKKTNEM